ncbi:hypothetical protein CPB86DRAFT_146536 [Serendipita vermifera]|nr:hypothetical protein CPB86DRAFT_146536 [Serendipita vermifera]
MAIDQFGRLADELVLKIINYLYKSERELVLEGKCSLNQDLWRISTCSRRFQRIVLPVLYHTIYIPPTTVLIRFLQLAIEYPTHARLVKNLSLCFSATMGGWIETLDPTPFLKAAQTSVLPEEFILEMKGRRPEAYRLLLLHLLSHLEVLSIEINGDYECEFQTYFSKFLTDGLLSPKLREVSLFGLGDTDGNVLIPTLLYPSMTKVKALGLSTSDDGEHCRYSPWGIDIVSQRGTSHVETLSLRHGTLLNRDLKILLRLPKALRSFCYHEDESFPHTVADLNAFRRAINLVATSIEDLDLRWENKAQFSIDYTPWSLANFTSLRVLHIMYQLVYGPNPTAALSVAGSFPVTLEVLALYPHIGSDWTNEGYIDSWKRLLTQKSPSCLPRLRLIAHEEGFLLLRPLVTLASRCNVHIALKPAELELLAERIHSRE